MSDDAIRVSRSHQCRRPRDDPRDRQARAARRRRGRRARSATPTLLSTVCTSKPREGIDFFPLTVDVEERMYAAGKIPGSFFRREGRPGEQAILTCRLTDRPLRPSFPDGLPQRGAGHRHHPRRRPGEPARHRVDQRRVGRAHGLGHPVQRPDRRGAPRAPRRRVDRAPDLPGGRRVDVRDRRRRPSRSTTATSRS